MDGSAIAHFVDTFVQLFHEAMKYLRSSVRAHALIPGKIRVREISATTAAFVIIAERYATAGDHSPTCQFSCPPVQPG